MSLGDFFFPIPMEKSCKCVPLKVNRIFLLWHQAWPHNDLPLLETKVQLLHYIYLWPPILWHIKAMEKWKIEALVTEFLEKFAISMRKEDRKFCRRGLTHLDATSIFKKMFKYLRHPVIGYNWFLKSRKIEINWFCHHLVSRKKKQALCAQTVLVDFRFRYYQFAR